MNKKRYGLALIVFVAMLCAAFSGATLLRSQESEPKQKTIEKKKATPANSADAANTAPKKGSSNRPGPKDTSRVAKTPVGKETVWVNTATGVYHKKGARYYGKTKEGKYMPEDEAVQAGYKRSKRN